jgi:hypothetical protein
LLTPNSFEQKKKKMSMEFRSLRAGKKKKHRPVKRENTQLVEEQFCCMILGDKMSVSDSIKLDRRKSQLKTDNVKSHRDAPITNRDPTTATTTTTDTKKETSTEAVK